MPVRKIPKNHLCVTGSFASRKNGGMNEFESPLEKEYMLLLDFDERVERYESQPVNIPIPGIPRGYTPDVLVFYLPDPNTGEFAKPLLTEVKHTDDLERNAAKYAPKFALAEQYAVDRGWEFHVTTQVDIRTPRLSNLKFLREYRNISPADRDRVELVRVANKIGDVISPDSLLEHLAVSDDDRLYWLPIIWHAVLTRQLVADWNGPLDHNTVLRLSGNA
ncbi:MAG TPA: TnsA endonuclease N-terminal domain-containing protein [Burkholderiaceae bacterium]|nr:TnsA endonuclease N-terminal domain-containing protein [Burkholderiaceae bacterium]